MTMLVAGVSCRLPPFLSEWGRNLQETGVQHQFLHHQGCRRPVYKKQSQRHPGNKWTLVRVKTRDTNRNC